jgi:Tol biopolymer transport system component
MTMNSLTERGVWAYDISRGTLTPLARDGEAVRTPEWFPDGQRVAFGWLKDGPRSLVVQPADGTSPPRVLVAGEFIPMSFRTDEQLAAYREGQQAAVLVTFENGKVGVKPLLDTPKDADSAAFSRDGNWLAYASNVSGRNEVYVRPYPGPGKAEQVSLEGGSSPAWNPNGRELFFDTGLPAPTRRMMAVDFAPGSPPRIGRPQTLFEFDPTDLVFACLPSRCYDVALDGQSFYAMQVRTPPPRPVVTHINLIPNWFEELKAKAPVKR